MSVKLKKYIYELNTDKSNVLVLIACAGKSSRMGKCKALLKINNRTFIKHMIIELLNANLVDIFITLPEYSNYYNCLKEIKNYPVVFSKNLWPALGLTGSIKTALNNRQKKYKALLICPIDMPFLSYKLLNMFFKLWRQQRLKPSIIIPKINKKRGHPILFSSHFFDKLCFEKNLNGAKDIINENKIFIKEFQFNNEKIICNLNTIKDYFHFIS